jgi:hypothetical protein
VIKRGAGIMGTLTNGQGPLCVRTASFTYRRSNSSRDACTKSGGAWVNFQRVAAQSNIHKLTFGSGGKCID